MSGFRRLTVAVCTVALATTVAACTKAAPSAPVSSSTSTPAAARTSSSTPSAAPTTPSPDAGDILKKAKDRALKAKSVRMYAVVRYHGEKVTLQVNATTDGRRFDLTAASPSTGSYKVIKIGDAIYMKANRTFLLENGDQRAASLLANKWFKVPGQTQSDLEDLFQLADVRDVLKDIFRYQTSQTVEDEVGEDTLNGKRVWVLTDADGADSGRLYIDEATHRVLRFEGDAPIGRYDFTHWNEDLKIARPAGDILLD